MTAKQHRFYYLHRNQLPLEKRLMFRFSAMRSDAKRRGIAWRLTFDDVLEMWRAQHGKDFYTGARMYLTVGRGLYFRKCTVSIDRKNQKASYELGNVVLCRFDTNHRKRGRSDVDFMESFLTYEE